MRVSPDAASKPHRRYIVEGVTVLTKLLRDAWYAGALVVLGAVAVISLVFVVRGGGSGASAQITYIPPTATSVPPPTPIPTPRLDQYFLDTRRKQDLGEVAGVLADYRTRFGGYPTTGDKMQALCRTPGDAGCQLESIAPELPTSDGFFDYWYRSDGSAFVLVTRVETPATGSASCPDDVPVDLAGLSLYCVGPKGDAQP
jgi:hypothetical protein